MHSDQDTGKSNLMWFADLRKIKLGQDMEWQKVVNDWGSEYFMHVHLNRF